MAGMAEAVRMNVDTRYSVGMPSILCVSISVRQTSAACDVSLCSSLVRSVGSAGSAETVSAKVKMRNSVNVVCILCVSLSIRQITTALQLSSVFFVLGGPVVIGLEVQR